MEDYWNVHDENVAHIITIIAASAALASGADAVTAYQRGKELVSLMAAGEGVPDIAEHIKSIRHPAIATLGFLLASIPEKLDEKLDKLTDAVHSVQRQIYFLGPG